MSRIRVTMLALAVSLPASAPAQATKCLEPREAEALIVYASPTLVDRIAKRCAMILPATSAFLQSAPVIAARYRIDAAAAWGEASLAFDRIAPTPISKTIGEAATRKVIDTIIASTLAQRIKLADCRDIDRAIDALQPLPPSALARLALIVMAHSSTSGQSPSPITICQDRP